MLIYQLCIFFGEVSVKGFGPFIKLSCFFLYRVLNFLYILNNNILSDVFCNIFSQSMAYLFILLILPFTGGGETFYSLRVRSQSF